MSDSNTSEQTDSEGRGPRLLRVKYAVLLALGIGGVIYHLWFAYTGGIEMDKHMIIHLGLMMVAVCVVQFDIRAPSGSLWQRFDNLVLIPAEAVGAVAVAVYFWTNFNRLAYEALGIYTDMDLAIGILLIVLSLDLTRRAFGLVLPLVGLLGIVYALFGPYFPGILQHQGLSLTRMVTSTTVEFNGVYDIILQVSATYIVIFIVFAAFLEAYGALEYFIKIGAKAGSYFKSGITQTAVISSVGMGSVNGSAAANSATTGAFTIPLLKNQGIDKDTAASVESVASSGGQIMPPIMGAAAFIMADITGTSYVHIITIGLLPALLFYGTVAFAVHSLTLKEGANIDELADTLEQDEEIIDGSEDVAQTVDDVALGSEAAGDEVLEETADSSGGIISTLIEGMYLWLPVLVLVYLLMVLRFTPLFAGFWTIVVTIPTAFVQRLLTTEDNREAVRTFAGDTLDACRLGIANTAPIALATAVMGLFVGILSLTGFTQTFAQSLVNLSGGVFALLLLFAMVASILFGMGMPTVAAYIVSVLLIAPSLAQLGVRIETAHFFVFYFAILSAITPPVAIACIITSELAGGKFWRVCKKSLTLGAPLFVLPYVFVVNEELLYWSVPETLITVPLAFLGLIGISNALLKYMNGPLSRLEQGGLFVVSLGALFAPVLPMNGSMTLGIRVACALVLLGFLGWKNNIPAQLRRITGTA